MLSILRKARLKDKEMRILMLGLDNAGKTTIVKKIMNEDVNSVSPTLGFIIKTIEYDGYKLNIWDVGGQKTLRTYWKNYFEKTDTLIWVVDATDRERIDDCRRELEGLLQEEVRGLRQGEAHSALTHAAAHGSELARVQEQERRVGIHDRRRGSTGTRARRHQDAQMDHHGLQRHDGHEPARRAAVGGAGREEPAVSVLIEVLI
ncbi:ADP-ribosylation factor-like protein 2, variant 3 [Paraphaeosphaeria minitans]